MSKTITSGLLAHLAQSVTTLTTCWQLVRTDGTVFAFTALDVDLVVEGVTYRSAAGFSRTAIVTGSVGQVDNLETVGFFSETGITEQDLKNGLFYFATIYVFMVNWMDLSMGICRMRRGWLGETTRNQNGTFRAELRGLTQALVQEFDNIISPVCKADLGDSKCLIPILPPAWQANQPYIISPQGSWVCPAAKSSAALAQAIFQAANAGTSGATEPVWNTGVGELTTDGEVTWTSYQPLRLVGTVVTPLTQHQCVVEPLIFPAGQQGNVATLTVQNNVSNDSSLEISDGNPAHPPVVVHWTFDTAGSTVIANILTDMAAAVLAGTTDIVTLQLSDLALRFTNNSGVQGTIVKSGDVANPPALLISDFTPGYMDQGTITWITGANAGVSMELKLYDINTTSIVMWLAMNYPIIAGDTFWYYPGCDKKRETCWKKFANILNFRGEPDCPGLDRMLGYPEAGS